MAQAKTGEGATVSLFQGIRNRRLARMVQPIVQRRVDRMRKQAANEQEYIGCRPKTTPLPDRPGVRVMCDVVDLRNGGTDKLNLERTHQLLQDLSSILSRRGLEATIMFDSTDTPYELTVRRR